MSKKTIAIIPVAGAGTRLRPFTYTQPKALIPVAGKPIITYIVDDLKRNGIQDFIFIVGYFGEKIVDYIKATETNIHSEFVYQHDRQGLGHAIFLANEFVEENDDIIIALGDSMIEVSDDFFTSSISSIAIKKVKDPVNFGVAEFNEEGKLVKLVEKPKFPKSNEALVGWYKITETKQLFQILEKYNRENIRTNGEIQLTDALNEMLLQDIPFVTYTVDQWLDLGNGEVLLTSNAVLLKKFGSHISNKAKITNSVIIDPVSIADESEILDSIIGPNVTIGKNSKIERSSLSNGIIGEYSEIHKMNLEDFVIGSDSNLKGSVQSISVGDNTDLDFSK